MLIRSKVFTASETCLTFFRINHVAIVSVLVSGDDTRASESCVDDDNVPFRGGGEVERRR